MKEIERQLDLGLCNLPPKSKCLLKIDPADLLQQKVENQQYWLSAILAASIAGERVAKLMGGKTTSWKEIVKNGKFTLPTHNPPPEDNGASPKAGQQQPKPAKTTETH